MAKKIFDHPLLARGDEKTKAQLEYGGILVSGNHTVNNKEIKVSFKKGEFFSFLNFLVDKFKGDRPAEPAIEDLQQWYSEFSGVPIPEKPKVDISGPADIVEEVVADEPVAE